MDNSSVVLVTLLLGAVATTACTRSPPPWPLKADSALPATRAPTPMAALQPDEVRFADLRQLTFGGENAEAYWSHDGNQLIFQSSPPGAGCDQIYRLDLSHDPAQVMRVSNGLGATTCAYFMPGDREVVYASTHRGSPACPPKPDRSQGYVWPIYSSYDIFRATADGLDLRRLTDAPGYDAEATVCAKDGSIVFTSVRDGDLELYRMDADGDHVTRLTNSAGYDGGAFFSADCTRIVWRASRPQGEKLAQYQQLLEQGLVRPHKLELYVANADGSDARQVTYLDAASFAPFFFPSGERIIFSSNYGDPRGREFELWAVDIDGTNLERITYSPGFDGFPMFSPDGRRIAFGSNRATAPGEHDTNVFTARWIGGSPRKVEASAANRTHEDVARLADPSLAGRGLDSDGLTQAGVYIEQRFADLGAAPAFPDGFRQHFDVVTGVSVEPATRMAINGVQLAVGAMQPLPQSANGTVSGRMVAVGHGIVAPELGIDDYRGVAVRGKIALIRRFVPETVRDATAKAKYGDLQYKVWGARERGATAVVIVDAPARQAGAPLGSELPEEAAFPELSVQGHSRGTIPAVMVKRAEAASLFTRLQAGGFAQAEITVQLAQRTEKIFNVVGRFGANVPAHERRPGAIVIGAHYDHLGFGGEHSLSPESHEPHLGADDNASGVAVMLEVMRGLRTEPRRRREVVVVAFSGEEAGVLGSSHFVRNLPPGLSAETMLGMLNMDMVGRMRDNQLMVLGGESASEWPALVSPACVRARVRCKVGGSGYGRSDHTPFFAAGVPVLQFFTGAHSDYHKPSDTVAKINAAGMGQVAAIVRDVAMQLNNRDAPLTYRKATGAAVGPRGDVRASGASLGTVPDYGGAPAGQPGMLLAGVRSGGPAEKAGMQRGDVLVALGPHAITSVRDLMYALGALTPGQAVKAVVVRGDRRVTLVVTMGKPRRRR